MAGVALESARRRGVRGQPRAFAALPRLGVLGALLLASGPAAAQPDAAAQALGVFALTGTPDRVVEEAMVRAVEAAPGYRVLSPARMTQEELAAIDKGVRCPERTVPCLGRVAQVAGIHTVLIATLRAGVPYAELRLDLVDAAAGRSRNTATVMLSAHPDERRLGVRAAVNAVLRGAPLRGALRVVNPPPGELWLDGEPVSVEALSSLPPGVHRLEHRQERLAADVDVLAGLEREVMLTPLAPGDAEPPPSTAPYRGPGGDDVDEASAAADGDPWWLPGSLAVGAAGAAAALVPGLALMAAGFLVAPYDDQRGELDADTFNSRRGMGRMMFAGGVGVAALGVAAAAGLGFGAVSTLPGDGE